MRRFVVGAAVALLLAGCGGDPKADPSPSTSASPSASAAPTPTAPVMPEAATMAGTAGAIAFVKYFVAVINHATATGDTSPLRDASLTMCKSCEAVIGKIEELYSSGGRREGGAWRLVEVRITHAGRPWRVAGHVTYAAQRIVRPGKPTEAIAGGDYDMEFALSRQDGKWQVKEWIRL